MKAGDVVTRTVTVQRVDLVRYAGASGDFNPIHWNEAVATSVGLPDVIAHGMYTQAQLGQLLGDPARIVSFQVRFSAPLVVPERGSAPVDLTATVESVEGGIATIVLTATSQGVALVKSAVAKVRV